MYVSTHFADEEKIQRQYGYPDYENHHRIHEAFKSKVADFARRLDKEGASDELLNEVKHTCGDWLVNHIKGQDLKIGAYIRGLKKKGVAKEQK
jgi:hemerythrin